MKRRSRISIVTSGLARGGSEVQVANLSQGLKSAGWVVSVITLQGGPIEEELRAADIPVVNVNLGRLATPHGWLKLRDVLRGLAPDVVQTQAFRANLWGRLAAISAPLPVIASVRATYTYLPSMYYPVERLLSRWSAAIITPSRATAKHLADVVKIPGGLVEVIPNAVDSERFTPDASGIAFRRLWKADGSFLVLAPGRLVRQKNHHGLINAFEALSEARKDSILIIAGSGPLESDIRRRALGLGPHVVFAGELDRDQMVHAMAAADVVCLASRFEGMPNVVLEAMASAKPVVASAVDGVEEVISHGRHGFLSPPGDDQAMADALIKLADDPVLRATMGAAGRQLVVRQHNLELNVQRHVQLYERVINFHRPRHSAKLREAEENG